MSLHQHSTSEVRLLGQQHEHALRLSTGRPIETQSTGDPQTSLPETTDGQAPWLRALAATDNFNDIWSIQVIQQFLACVQKKGFIAVFINIHNWTL
jgi:hypothetical protein